VGKGGEKERRKAGTAAGEGGLCRDSERASVNKGSFSHPKKGRTCGACGIVRSENADRHEIWSDGRLGILFVRDNETRGGGGPNRLKMGHGGHEEKTVGFRGLWGAKKTQKVGPRRFNNETTPIERGRELSLPL